MPSSARRASIGDAGQDQGEEIAAHAWSYAAAIECGIPPDIVFHEHGYQGSGARWQAGTMTATGRASRSLCGWG